MENQIGMDEAAYEEGPGTVMRGGLSRAIVLCEQNKELMLQFSDRCILRLKNQLLLKPIVSLFQHFFAANVLKEVEKDRLIIEFVVAGFEQGKKRNDLDVNELFEMTKAVDADFIKKSANPLFSMKIRYDDFAEIRKRRITAYINMLFDLLSNWQDVLSFNGVVKRTYPEHAYRGIITGILHLYNKETKMLSNSIDFHVPAGKAKHLIAEKLFSVMEKAATEVAASFTRRIYAGNDAACYSSGSPHANG